MSERLRAERVIGLGKEKQFIYKCPRCGLEQILLEVEALTLCLKRVADFSNDPVIVADVRSELKRLGVLSE